MPSTQERARAARVTDEETKASQQAQLVEEREARDARLKIGPNTVTATTPTKKTAAKRTATKTTAKKTAKKAAKKA